MGPKEPEVPDVTRIAEKIFEPRLRELRLAADQIEGQTLEQLQESLDRVNYALANPQSFGEVNVALSVQGGQVVPIVTSEDKGNVQKVGVLPVLLDRKRLILARIRELGGQSAEQLLEKLSSDTDGTNGATQQVAAEALEQLRAAQSAGRQAAELDQDLVRRRELVAIYERKAKVWQSFLARESVASIAGGILLLLLAATLVVAMFVGTTATDVVANAFLIILGYFFGQAATRERAPAGGPPAEL